MQVFDSHLKLTLILSSSDLQETDYLILKLNIINLFSFCRRKIMYNDSKEIAVSYKSMAFRVLRYSNRAENLNDLLTLPLFY
jgi:hypothetical protein